MTLAAQVLELPHPSPELFDGDGYLIELSDWSEELAEQLAEHDGLPPLGERHWQVINHIRDHHERLGGLPSMRRVCRSTGLAKDEVGQLFGGCLEIWRIAGLPNPGEEARAYL